MNTDHCIVTNFEGDIGIYRGLNLDELITEVATMELPDYPEELANFLSIEVLNLNLLEDLLIAHGTDLFYDAPRTY